MSLSVSRLVRVVVNLSPIAAARRSFGVLMVAGDSDVISGLERFRSYTTLEGVAADFGVDAPEYKAAALYFGQTPKPLTIMIGRWIRTASAAQNIGGVLTETEQLLSNFTSITNGGMVIVVDGTTKTLTGLDFSAETNLNGVASVIDTALTGATIAWNGTNFVVTSGTTGAGVKATGTVTFDSNPVATNTLVLNGVTLTFVASSPGANDILIGSDEVSTAANVQAYLNATSNVLLTVASYSTAAGVISIEYDTVGVAGNSYSLAETGTAITLSGATLTGGAVPSSVGYATTGSGTSISALLKLTSTTSQGLPEGYDAETPVECAAILANMSSLWYGLMFQASVQPTDDENIDVCDFINALDLKRIFGVTITNTNVLSALVDTDLASRMKDGGYKQCFNQYSSNAYAIASFFGRAFSVNFNANRSTITLMYKQEPGVTGEELTENQAAVLEDKRCNVFVNYVNDTIIIQYGVMSGSAYFDEIHGLDWFQDAIQNSCYNVLYQSKTKVPQTDAGVNLLTNSISGVCEEAVNNGLVAPGVWNADGFGQLENGQYLKTGYYIYAQPMALQSQADRETRVCPPIQVAVKLAGAIQELDILVDVNR